MDGALIPRQPSCSICGHERHALICDDSPRPRCTCPASPQVGVYATPFSAVVIPDEPEPPD